MNRRVSEMLRRWFGRPLHRTAVPTFRPRLECLEDRLAPAAFTVMNTNDTGVGSLRAAIVSANSSPGSTINFTIGSGQQSIVPASALPAITVPVTIDGTTQPGFTNQPLIVLNGIAAGAHASGLVLVGGNSTVKGLAIDNFAGFGLLLVSGGSNVVTQDNIGVNPAGTIAAPNSMGVFAIISNGNVIVNNVISGNTIYGVLLDASNNNAVVQNTIGLNTANTASLANGVAGVAVAAGSTGNQFTNNNISGNGDFGAVFADSTTTGNQVIGDTIGLNGANAAAANGVAGVVFAAGASNNTLGTDVISGNGFYGVLLEGAGTTGNFPSGNFIGITNSGNTPVANGDAGIAIQDGASGNVIGTIGGGNTIAGNTNVNVRILGAATTSNLLLGNNIGTNAVASTQIGDVDGVDITNAPGNMLSSNVIGGSFGVLLSGAGTTGNVLQANRIGTNAAGTALLIGDTNDIGVNINFSAAGNTIGGSTRALGNLITCAQIGIAVGAAGAANVIENNLVGTNLACTAALGQTTGILVNFSDGTQILNNVISGNSQIGVQIQDGNNVVVAGNFIGTDISGSTAVANGIGVIIAPSGYSQRRLIGGTTAAARNVISGNTTDGVVLQGFGVTNNLIEGNYIGTAANGTSALGNGKRGVFVTQGAYGNTIGGSGAGAGNVIAFNGDDGVLIGGNTGDTGTQLAGTGNAVLGNSIFSNGKIGIDLGPDDGVTANNSAGLVINSPTLSAAAALGNSVIVVGNWQGNTFTPGVYRVEVFANTSASGSGHGEGKIFLGAATLVVTKISNNFAFVLPDPAASGQVLSCTITDPSNNTSEFSTDVTVP